MKKIERELHKAFPGAVISTAKGGHLRIRLPNGKSVWAAATPGDRRNLHNVRTKVKRALSAGMPPPAGNN